MGTRRDFAKQYVVSLYKKLDPEQPTATERAGDFRRNLFRFRQRHGRHALWLPRLTIVTLFLPVAYWFTKTDTVDVLDC